MKKRYPMALIGGYILTVLIGVVWHAGGVSAEDTIKLSVNSQTKSTAIMSNMQPGDEGASEYTVINEGAEPFDYFVDFEFLSGDAELYNILQMTLQKEGVILYSGVMSQAEGRVAVGSLPAGGEEAIRMDVVFPAEAGNEFQGKQVGVAFNFSASAPPDPSIPGGTQAPPSFPAPAAAPAATAAPGTDEVTATGPTVPLGEGESGQATPSPVSGSIAAGSSPDPSPGPAVTIDAEELPLSGPDGGDKLPDTAEAWYNLVFLSMTAAILSLIVLRRLNSRK